MTPQAAPQWQVTRWFNGEPTTVEDHRGKVIVLGAFQMLCPGCVSHGLPQLQRVRETFSEQDVAVIGLHTVFEHHAAMTPVSLEAFLMEYRYTFPVAVDAHDDPLGASVTMKRYGLRGTPSLVLIDRGGLVRHSSFGRDPDLQLGALVAQLVGETAGDMRTVPKAEHGGVCSVDGECS